MALNSCPPTELADWSPRGRSGLLFSFHPLPHPASPQVQDPACSTQYLSFHDTSCLGDHSHLKFCFAVLQSIFYTAVILLKYNWYHIIPSTKPFVASVALRAKPRPAFPAACSSAALLALASLALGSSIEVGPFSLLRLCFATPSAEALLFSICCALTHSFMWVWDPRLPPQRGPTSLPLPPANPHLSVHSFPSAVHTLP